MWWVIRFYVYNFEFYRIEIFEMFLGGECLEWLIENFYKRLVEEFYRFIIIVKLVGVYFESVGNVNIYYIGLLVVWLIFFYVLEIKCLFGIDVFDEK